MTPAAIEKEGGTVTAVPPLDKATGTPPEGATALKNTVQVDVAPGAIVPGVHVMLDTVTDG